MEDFSAGDGVAHGGRHALLLLLLGVTCRQRQLLLAVRAGRRRVLLLLLRLLMEQFRLRVLFRLSVLEAICRRDILVARIILIGVLAAGLGLSVGPLGAHGRRITHLWLAVLARLA